MPLSSNIRNYLDLGGLPLPDNYTFGEIKRKYPEQFKTRYFAVKQGDVFHAMPCKKPSEEEGAEMSVQSWGYVYGPVHPSTAYEDVEGATYAYDDGTYWIFAPCSPHEQIDFAADARTFCYDQFGPVINRASLLENKTKARALIDFAEQASNQVFDTVRDAFLGKYHRDPHKDHKRDLALEAITKVWAVWMKNAARVADRTLIRTNVELIQQQLRRDFTIDFRHTRADGWAAAGVDPVSGNEYIYTLVANTDAITDVTKLPDPNWNFDAAPVGGYNKGGQIYTDGQPTRTSELPKIIRFYRSIPPTLNPTPGQDIGSVAWTQEEAY